MVLNNSDCTKNYCKFTNNLTLNDYCNLTYAPKFSFGDYFSSPIMARHMGIAKVIQNKNGSDLGHWKG